jgi:hypothetical protein
MYRGRGLEVQNIICGRGTGTWQRPAVLVRQQPSVGVEDTRVHGARFLCALRPGPRCALGPPGPYTATLLHLSCDLTAPTWHVLC